jgi:asparagine synthase (glutamine-hydrolysing)
LLFNKNGDIIRKNFFKIDNFINFNLHEQNSKLSKSETVDYLHKELQHSTESQLKSDAPVAAFVSGGVDSSLIAAIAKTKYPNLKLYHCNVNSESETQAATLLAKELGLELIVESASDQDIIANTAITTYHYEAPLHYHTGSCVPFYLLSKKAGKDGIKVILTGEGSDEYFLGYPNIAIRPYLHKIKKISGTLQNLFHTIPRMEDFLWQKLELLPSEQLRNLMFRYELQDRTEGAASKFNFISNKTEKDLRILCIDMVIGNVSTLLQRNDRLGMAGSLESRFPFLGENIAELAINLPSKYKIRKTLKFTDYRHAFYSDKWIVREIANMYLPNSLAYRRKFGFQSSVYRRLSVSPEFFNNGFIQEYYGMNDRAITRLLNTAPEKWKESIFSLEIWGSIFPLKKSFDEVQEQINKYSTINSK